MFLVKMLKYVFKKLGYELIKDKRSNILKGLKLPNEVLTNCRVLSTREDVLKLLPKQMVVAEIGVAYGEFSRQIIDNTNPIKFYAIDYFKGDEFWGRNTFSENKLSHIDYIKQQFKVEIDKGIFHIEQGLSWDVLNNFEDNFFDYVYLDAGHDYESVKKDIHVLLKKIKNGGIIQFNDYLLYDWVSNLPYGVVRAVDELLQNKQHEVLYYCLNTAGFNDIVVRINK